MSPPMTAEKKPATDDRMLVYVPAHPLIKRWVSVLRNEETACAAFTQVNTRSDFGYPSLLCAFCDASVWAEEVTGKPMWNGQAGYSICCGKGKVLLPPLQQSPGELRDLLLGRDRASVEFRKNIGMYNNIFAFTSMGGKIDKSFNDGGGPYVFRLNGQTYHRMGSLLHLLPPDGARRMYAQFYMYDGDDDVRSCLCFPRHGTPLNQNVLMALLAMIDRDNNLAKIFGKARDRFKEEDYTHVRIKLLEKRTDGRCEYSKSISNIKLACSPNAIKY